MVRHLWRHRQLRTAPRVLEQVTAFFEAHGNSRFQHVDAPSSKTIPNRVGFCSDDLIDGRQYLVFPQAFKDEICQGIDHKWALQTLLTTGWIKPDKAGKSTHAIRVTGEKPRRYYLFERTVLDQDILQGDKDI